MTFPFDSRVGQSGNYINPLESGDRYQRTQRNWNAGQIRMSDVIDSESSIEDRASLRRKKINKDDLILNPFAFASTSRLVNSLKARLVVLLVISIICNGCTFTLQAYRCSVLLLLLLSGKKPILKNTMSGRIYRIAYGNELQSAWKIIHVQIDRPRH